ncbi:MAG: hypothetical protein IKD44_06195 [Lentisphaeria bacterium]|nr:hypothetical protein [Lentisphaeria bacterium]
MMIKQALAILMAAAAFELTAEVYLLGPGRGRNAADRELSAVLPGVEKILHSERITVNSFASTLEVSAVKKDIEEIALLLKRMKADKLAISGGTIRFERKVKGSALVERYLLIASRKDRPVTCFKMLVPEKLPPPQEWPSELPPLPAGAVITAVTRLADGGICGEFRSAPQAPHILLRNVDALMRNRKMFPAGNEIASRNGGRGEIFFDKNAIVWVTFSDSGNGAFFYRRRK